MLLFWDKHQKANYYINRYDEEINRRPRPAPIVPVGQQFPAQRQWKIANDCWVPEKSDYPLQGEPTKWGLGEKKRFDRLRQEDKYKSQLPNLTEYTDRYQKPPGDVYLTRQRTFGVPREISASFNDINVKLGEIPKSRSTSSSLREPQARDVMDTIYDKMLARSSKAPRTYYYLGKIPTNGALDVYSMKDYETLTPVREPLPTTINDVHK